MSEGMSKSFQQTWLFKGAVLALTAGVTVGGAWLLLKQAAHDAEGRMNAAPVVRHAYAGPPVPETIASFSVDPAVGKQLYNRSCASCHGPTGGGMPPQGVALRDSAFVLNSTDEQLVAFTTRGRRADDPQTLTRRVMPPLGDNRQLTQQDVADIVAYMRQMQVTAAALSTH